MFHRISKQVRRELKIRRAAGYFRRVSIADETQSRVLKRDLKIQDGSEDDGAPKDGEDWA